MDVVGSNLYNLLERDSSSGGYVAVEKVIKNILIEDMFIGDEGHFPNYDGWETYHPDPASWAWQAENIIKVEPNRFWGYVGTKEYTVKSKQEWEERLREEYNKLDSPKRFDGIPGLERPIEVRFLDVARIAMQLFDLRRNKFR